MVNNENIKIRFNKYLSKALYVKGGCNEVIKYNFTMVEGTTKYLRFSVYDDETGKRKDLSDCSIEFYLVNGNTEVKKDNDKFYKKCRNIKVIIEYHKLQ